jgi:hypothetical protein
MFFSCSFIDLRCSFYTGSITVLFFCHSKAKRKKREAIAESPLPEKKVIIIDKGAARRAAHRGISSRRRRKERQKQTHCCLLSSLSSLSLPKK